MKNANKDTATKTEMIAKMLNEFKRIKVKNGKMLMEILKEKNENRCTANSIEQTIGDEGMIKRVKVLQ